MKKILLISLAILFLGFTPHVFAEGFTALAPIPGLTDPTTATSVVNSQGFANFFNNLYKYCIGLAAALAVIEIIWGGLEISTQDSISKQGAGRERITQAVYGLILVLSPVLVFSIINPRILNLSIGISPIGAVSSLDIPNSTGTVAPVGSASNGTAGMFAPQGRLILCLLNNCDAADQECRQGAVGAASAAPNVVCVTQGGQIDTAGSAAVNSSSSSFCPPADKKEIECVTRTIITP